MITFFSNLIRNPMESACPYLEGGSDSLSNQPSGFFRRDVDSFQVSLTRGRDRDFIYLLREAQISLYQ